MTLYTLPLVGQLDFSLNEYKYWEVEVDTPLGTIEIDFNTDDDAVTEAQLRKAEPILAGLAALDQQARAAIRADFAEGEDATSVDYLEFHAEELSPEELLACFGTSDAAAIGIEQLLKALRLKRIGFYLHRDEDFAVMDYHLDNAGSDYMLVIYLTGEGKIDGVGMES